MRTCVRRPACHNHSHMLEGVTALTVSLPVSIQTYAEIADTVLWRAHGKSISFRCVLHWDYWCAQVAAR